MLTDKDRRRRSTCCATPARTFSRPPSAACAPTRRSASAPRSTTASTTTSRSRSRSRPKISRAFEAEMRKVVAEKYPFVRAEVNRAEARRRVRRRSAQARATVRARRRRGHLDVHGRAVHRSVPRPARAGHVVPQALQAAAHRRRVLARRREAADAAAHLRHGVLQEGRSRRVPASARGGEAARPPRARQAARPLSDSPVLARRRVLDASAARSIYNALDDFVRERQRDAFHEIKTPLIVQQDAVGDLGTLGKYQARTCSSCSTTRRASTTCRSSR